MDLLKVNAGYIIYYLYTKCLRAGADGHFDQNISGSLGTMNLDFRRLQVRPSLLFISARWVVL